MHGLFLIMYEPWVLDVKLDTLILDPADPDQPLVHCGITSDKRNSSKQDRTGRAMVQLVQSTTCLHKFFSQYLNDSSSGTRHTTNCLLT